MSTHAPHNNVRPTQLHTFDVAMADSNKKLLISLYTEDSKNLNMEIHDLGNQWKVYRIPKNENSLIEYEKHTFETEKDARKFYDELALDD